MDKLYRVWLGNKSDDFSGFSLYLDPMCLDSEQDQLIRLFACFPGFDSALLFHPLSDEPSFVLGRSGRSIEVLQGVDPRALRTAV